MGAVVGGFLGPSGALLREQRRVISEGSLLRGRERVNMRRTKVYVGVMMRSRSGAGVIKTVVLNFLHRKFGQYNKSRVKLTAVIIMVVFNQIFFPISNNG